MQTGRILLHSILWRGLYYVTAFISNILIARHFQASVSGSIYYISSIYALVLLLGSLSLESGIIYFSAKKEIPAGRLFNFSIAWSFIIGVITFFVVYLFFNQEILGIEPGLITISAVLFITGNLLTTYCTGFFYAVNNFIVPNIIIICCTGILIILIPYNGRSVIPAINDQNYFYIYFISFFVQGICMVVAAGIKIVRKISFSMLSFPQVRMLFQYCALAFTGNIIYFLLYRIDYWFVEKYCTTEQLGNYIQVSKIGHLFFILPTILASAVFPITAAGKKENIAQLLTLLSRSIFFVYLVACMFLALTGNWLFPFVFGQSFSEMYQPFLWLIPGILSLSGLFTLAAYFAGKNQVRTNITGSVYALLVILAGDMIFIPRYGIRAAALVSSIGYMVYQGYMIAVFKKEFNTSLSRFFIIKKSDFLQISKSIRTSLSIRH